MSDDVDLITRYQDLVRHSADVITLVADDGTIEYQSPSVEPVLGYSPTTLVGDPVLEHVHPLDRDRVGAAIAEAGEADEGTAHQAEYRFRHADGSWVWLESTASPRPDDAAGGFVVNSRDVTARREDQAVLDEERELYETVVEQVDDAITITRDRRVVFANARCHELLGYEAGQLEGMPVASLLAPADRERVEAYYERRMAASGTEPPGTYEVRFLARDGAELVGEVNVERITYEGTPAILAAIRDVTERKQYEQQLEALTQELEALNRVIRHDIRNDMAVILGWAELLEDYVDDDGQEYLDMILASGEHVVELTDNARDYVEALVAGERAEQKPVPLRSVLETELALRREHAPKATFVVDGELPDVAVTANEMLESVFANLLSNAVMHHPAETPHIVLSAAVEGEEAVVRVADDGPGVPDDRKETVFGKGEKGLDSPGTGIGLYLVRTLVEQFGGTVHVEDNEPEGAVFVVRLPLVG